MRTTFAQWAARIVHRAATMPAREREAYLTDEIADALNDAYRAGASTNVRPLKQEEERHA